MHSLRLLLLTIALLTSLAVSNSVTGHQDPEQAGYIEVEGGKIWYRMNGMQFLSKKAALIVLHGGPGGTHRSNMPLVDLANERPVILYDQLDTGNSERPNNPENWTVSRFLSEIDSIRKALQLHNVIVLGHSWGGTLAAEYAVKNPKGLKAVILSSPLINTQRWIEDADIWRSQLPKDVEETLRKHEAAGTTNSAEYRAAERTFLSRHMCRKTPCPGTEYRADGPAWNPVLYEYMWGPTEFHATGTLKNYDVSKRLNTINIPSLMICGEFDEAAPRTCNQYGATIDGNKTVIIPDAGHATMAENEALYLETIKEFLTNNGL